MNGSNSTVRRCIVFLTAAAAAGLGKPMEASGPPGWQSMKQLTVFAPITLGKSAASASGVCATGSLGRRSWVVLWLDASGAIVQSTGKVGGREWSKPAPVFDQAPPEGFSALCLTGDDGIGWRLAAKSRTGTQPVWRAWQKRSWTAAWTEVADFQKADEPAEAGLPDRVLAWTKQREGRVALRSGRRVVGVPPRFPSAALVVCMEDAAGWRDWGFADEVPDVGIDAAAVAVAEGQLLAAYVIQDADGRNVCRVIQAPLKSASALPSGWRELPAYPQEPGMAGLLAGVHDGVLIAAGGANFPDAPPWEGGKKVTHDSIYVLLPGEKSWRPAGHLPEPRAYAATVSVPGGVLAAGGENATKVFQDTLLLRWDGKQVVIDAAPRLPVPTTSAVAAVLDGSVYLAGGYTEGSPRLTHGNFWRLDLTNFAAGWQVLPTWPGPSRGQAVMAAVDGEVYLLSGLEIQPGAEDKPKVTYLQDAYRYRPGKSWEKLPDLPWSAIASPSPAPATTSPARVFVLGGVDGRQAEHLPRETLLPNDIIYFDVAQHQWKLWPECWPDSVVTVPAVQTGDEWIIVSGEIISGARTTHAWAWKISPTVPEQNKPDQK